MFHLIILIYLKGIRFLLQLNVFTFNSLLHELMGYFISLYFSQFKDVFFAFGNLRKIININYIFSKFTMFVF